MTVSHNKEVKVFLQRLKLLEYEQEKSNMHIEDDGEGAKQKENKYFEDRMKDMKKVKHDLKQQQIEDEKKYFDKSKKLEVDNSQKQKMMYDEQDDHLSITEKRYQEKLGVMKEELELKLKVDIH